jgi:hypothetical protein
MLVHTKEFSTTLWELRSMLDMVEYRLVVQQLVLAAGDVRFLLHAAGDVNDAYEKLAEFDAARQLITNASAQELRLAEGSPLSSVIAAVADAGDAELADALRAHLSALEDVKVRIGMLAERNARLAAMGSAEARAYLELLSSQQTDKTATTYDRDGKLVDQPAGVRVARTV